MKAFFMKVFFDKDSPQAHQGPSVCSALEANMHQCVTGLEGFFLNGDSPQGHRGPSVCSTLGKPPG